MRIENSGVCYSSFSEYASANKIVVKTKDIKDKQQRKDKFMEHHKCRGCGQYLVLVPDTNIMRCSNPVCRGIKRSRKDKEGNDIVYYDPSYDILEEKWASYASALFE